MGNRRNDDGRTKPVLTVREAAGVTRGVALVLHGGRSHSYEPVEARHLSPARMVPFAKQLHRAGGGHGLAVWTLRNSVRGWNGPDMSPLQDARWALARIHEEHPGVPVYLLGHSMGGLTAICAADDPQVDAVVALAPWLSAETPAGNVAGRRVLIVHGTTDRWTSPAASLKFARRASAGAKELRYVSLAGPAISCSGRSGCGTPSLPALSSRRSPRPPEWNWTADADLTPSCRQPTPAFR